MNKEQILARIDELQKTAQQALANFNAIQGALQECQLWLDKVNVVDEPQAE